MVSGQDILMKILYVDDLAVKRNCRRHRKNGVTFSESMESETWGTVALLLERRTLNTENPDPNPLAAV